jgi:PAS domain S-box-containing protein
VAIIENFFALSHRLGRSLGKHFSCLAPRQRSSVYRFLFTITLMLMALWIRLVMAPINAGLQYVTFFPAVTLAAFGGGFRAGLLATIIGLLFATYFFTPPYYSFSIEVLQTAFWPNVVFFIDGILISSLIETMHRYHQQLAQELKQTVSVNSALEEHTQHLKSLIDNQFAYVALLDTQGFTLEINKTAFDHFGYRREDVIQHYFYDLPCWSYNETVQAQLRTAMDAALQGQTVRYDVPVRKDDDLITVDFQISPVRNQEGNIVGLLPMAIDISGRVHAEEALKKSRAQLRTFIAQAPISIAMFDRDMNYLETSSLWLKEYGQGYTDLHGLNHYQAHPDLPDRLKLIHQQCLAGAMLRNDEDLWIQADGGQHWSRWAVMPWIDENGAIGGIIISAENITDRKQNEIHLAEQAQQLRDADRHKDEFLAMLAHELRNPLAPIRNTAEILKLKDLDPARLAWCTDIINRQVTHLVRMVDDLLDVSRISRGLIELKKEVLEVREFILPAVEACQPLVDAHLHRFALALPPDPLWIKGDRVRLAQVVSNLISNAAKYTEDSGDIRLSVEASDSEIGIHVCDNGSGIEPADLANLFDLFYQAERNLDRSQGGLGIGLSIVRNLVVMHGGHVQAFSAGRGQGSEFLVCLPRLSLPVSTLSITAAPSASSPNKLRILVVDDNRDAAESLALLLEADAHHVFVAYDGVFALEKARIERPDVILLDIGLPGMDGYSVAQALRQNNEMEGALLIALTGYGQPDDQEKSIAAGFDEHLVKPVDIEKLQQLLHSYQTSAFLDRHNRQLEAGIETASTSSIWR